MKKALKVIGVVFLAVFAVTVGACTIFLAKIAAEEELYNADY